MKTNLTPDEFVAVLASVCHIVEVLAKSKNYQDLLSHPRYSSTEFTLNDAMQALEEVGAEFSELYLDDSELYPSVFSIK